MKAQYATQTQSFAWNDCDVDLELSTYMQQHDYGVRGSPVWWESGDVVTDFIYVDGVKYTVESFKSDFGDNALAELDLLSADIDEDKWEIMEEEPPEYDEY
jgi:hypothetical protein